MLLLSSTKNTAGKNHNLLIANECIENLAIFKYFGTTPTNENYIHVEVKSRLNSGNA